MNPLAQSTNGQIIYNCAKACLDQAIAPVTLAELGCAITVYKILQMAGLPLEVTDPTSTASLYLALSNSGLFEHIDTPEAGCIVISPTGSQAPRSPLQHGHCGIVLVYGIGSNDSLTGTFRENFTIEGWNAYFATMGLFPVFYFRRK